MPLSAFVTADPHALTTNEDEIIFYNENAKVADMRLCKALQKSLNHRENFTVVMQMLLILFFTLRIIQVLTAFDFI